jgi:hypothetical protein
VSLHLHDLQKIDAANTLSEQCESVDAITGDDGYAPLITWANDRRAYWLRG